MNALLERLRKEFMQNQELIRKAQDAAAEEGRDLTEAEQANVDEWLSRCEALQPRIEHLAKQENTLNSVATTLAGVGAPGAPGAPEPIVRSSGQSVLSTRWSSAGAYLLDVMRANSEQDRAAVEEIRRALATQSAADNLGVVPQPLYGDVIKVVDASRPVVNAARPLPMPMKGRKFDRPKVTQRTQVGAQSAEHAEVPSRKMLLTMLEVSKDTYGGAVTVSMQDIDWTEPAIMDILISDLADNYAEETENAAADGLVAAVTAEEDLPAAATPAELLTALYGAAGQVYIGCKRLPNTLYAAVDQWERLGSFVDGDGRPLFPNLGPVNAPGSLEIPTFQGNPLGLRLVVSPWFASGTLIMGNSFFHEVYEQTKGQLQAVNVGLLSWDVGYYGYFAQQVTVAGAFCKLLDVA